MKFNYQARTKKGEVQTGAVEASSREAALSLLQKHQLFVTFLEGVGEKPFYAQKIKLFERMFAIVSIFPDSTTYPCCLKFVKFPKQKKRFSFM